MTQHFLKNPGFELGDQDWAKGTGWAISKDGPTSRSGLWRAIFTGASAADIASGISAAVRPGSKLSASNWLDGLVATAGTGFVRLQWEDLDSVLISNVDSAGIAFGTAYTQQTLTDIVAPARAKFVTIRGRISAPNGSTWRVDDFVASGGVILTIPTTAKIKSHTLLLARTIGAFDPLIGDTKFSDFNAGKSDKWAGVFTFIPLHPTDDLGELLGFLERLGQTERFFAFDPDRLVPKNGVVNGMLVDGASQIGTLLKVKSGPVSTTPLVAGDYVEVRDQFFQLLQDLVIGPEGTGAMHVNPAIRTSPADGEDVITNNPKMVARFTSEVPRRSDHTKWTQLSMSWEEV